MNSASTNDTIDNDNAKFTELYFNEELNSAFSLLENEAESFEP